MITRGQLRAWGACYLDERIAELVPESGLTPLQVCDLGIPAEDRLWVLLRPEVLGDAFGSVLATIVQRALDRAGVADPRSRDVVAALREGRVPDVAAANAAFARQTRAAAKAAAEAAAEAAAAWAESRAAWAAWAESRAAWAARVAAVAAWAAWAAWAANAEAEAAERAAWAAEAEVERQRQLDDVRRALGGAA